MTVTGSGRPDAQGDALSDQVGVARVADLAHVSRETAAPLTDYAALLRKWQHSINLVGRSTLPVLWDRHMLDSAQLAPLIAAEQPRQPAILDVGSGAGFPGLVLSILNAGSVHLVESDRRKASFLRQVCFQTGADAAIHADRVEALSPFPVDIITARAFAPLPRLVDLVSGFLHDNTVLWLLKGEEAERELTELAECWTVDVTRRTSRSDPRGVLLRLARLARRPAA